MTVKLFTLEMGINAKWPILKAEQTIEIASLIGRFATNITDQLKLAHNLILFPYLC